VFFWFLINNIVVVVVQLGIDMLGIAAVAVDSVSVARVSSVS